MLLSGYIMNSFIYLYYHGSSNDVISKFIDIFRILSNMSNAIYENSLIYD